MMNRKLLSIVLLVIIFLVSCEEKQSFQGKSTDFGTAEYYKPFLFCKSDTLILKKSLKYNFNDYATQRKSNLKIRLVDTSQNVINDNNIQFYINDETLEKNEFEINSEDSKEGVIKIGIQFLPGYPEGYTSGFLSISDHSLDIINNNDLKTSTELRIFKWEARHNIIMNPLKKILLWTGGSILLLLIVWLAILKPIAFKQFGKGSLTIQSPHFKNFKLHKAIELTLFNQTFKQNWRQRIFKGRKLCYSNSLFPAPIIVTPYSKNKIRIQLDPTYTIQPFTTTLDKGIGQYVITNIKTKEKITITYG